jgi:hypothetical protein
MHPAITVKLSLKILPAAGGSVAVATVCGITVYRLARQMRVDELRAKMSSVIEQSERVSQNMDYMHTPKRRSTQPAAAKGARAKRKP